MARLNVKKNKTVYSGVEPKRCFGQLRRNYELVFQGIEIKSAKENFVSEIQGSEKVGNMINTIEQILKDENVELVEKRKKIINYMMKMKYESWSLEQAEKLVAIMLDDNFFYFPEENKMLYYAIVMQKRLAVAKLLEAVKVKYEATNDVMQLKSLDEKLSYCTEQVSPTAVSSMKININSKIAKLKRDYIIRNLENNFSNHIIDIVRCISSRKIDAKQINEYIDCEISERMKKSNNNTIITTNENQYKNQIFYTVAKALEKYAEDYPIQNPEATIDVLESTFKMGFDNNFRAVINNYIERKEFAKAKNLCDAYAKRFCEDSVHLRSIDRARLMLQKAEIGEIILKAIKCECAQEEQIHFTKILEEKLKNHRYDYNSIPLGWTKDKSRKITLADIWGEEIDFVK